MFFFSTFSGHWILYKSPEQQCALNNSKDDIPADPQEKLLSINIVPVGPAGSVSNAPQMNNVKVSNTYMPPVVQAPNNQIRIQNVFSIQQSGFANLIPTSSGNNSLTSIATKKPSATVNPIILSMNSSVQSIAKMPSLPTIQAVTSLVMRPESSKQNQPNVSTIGATNVTYTTNATSASVKPQIRAIPTSALQAVRPMSKHTGAASTGPMRILLQSPSGKVPTSFTVTRPLSQAVTTTSNTITAIVPPNLIQSRVNTNQTITGKLPTLQTQKKPSPKKLIRLRKSDGSFVFSHQPATATTEAITRPLILRRSDSNSSEWVTANLPKTAPTNVATVSSTRLSLDATTMRKIIAPSATATVTKNMPVLLKNNVPVSSTLRTLAPKVVTTMADTQLKVPVTVSCNRPGPGPLILAKALNSITVRNLGSKKLPTLKMIPLKANVTAKEKTPEPKPIVSEPIEISDSSDDEDETPIATPTSAQVGGSAAAPMTRTRSTSSSKPATPSATPKLSPAPSPAPSPVPSTAPSLALTQTVTDTSTKKPAYPISGFLISDNLPLGKLIARMYAEHLIVQIPGIKSSCKFPLKNDGPLTNVDNYLDK